MKHLYLFIGSAGSTIVGIATLNTVALVIGIMAGILSIIASYYTIKRKNK